MSSAIELYNLLKDKLGDMETQALIAAINNGSGRYKDLATKTELKEDINQLRQDMAQHRTETKEEISELREDMAHLRGDIVQHRAETKEEISKLREDMAHLRGDIVQHRAETKEEIGKVREDMISHKVDVVKWVAAMLVAQAAVIAALVRLL